MRSRPILQGKLAEPNRLLRMAEDMAHVGYWHVDQISGESRLSVGAARVLGLPPGEASLPRDAVMSTYHREDLPRVAALIAAHIEVGGSFDYEARVVRPNGDVRIVVVRGQCQRNRSGSSIVTFGTIMDVTELKQAERRLAESELRLRALADTLPQMVWVEGDYGRATYANHRVGEYFGDVSYETPRDRAALNHPDDSRRVKRAWARAARHRSVSSTEGRLRRRDGAYRWHKLVRLPMVRDDGDLEWLSTALDIDEIVTAREALRVSEERLGMAVDAGSDGLWDRDLIRG